MDLDRVVVGDEGGETRIGDPVVRANGRHRFLLTAPPLRLPGAVGSPTTPIATV
jgi:hypothetical protein